MTNFLWILSILDKFVSVMHFSWGMHSQFWVEQGTVQKDEAVSSGKNVYIYTVSKWTQHCQMFRETVTIVISKI
jgi:hypothetical protein